MMVPSISIVIPNYHGARTIDRAIRSVIDQGYPRLQLVVIDGGSTDGSVDAIRAQESRIDYWTSEPDSGQSDAINKGLARCTGDVVNWLCSDDYLHPGSLAAVGAAFAAGDCDVVVGHGRQHFIVPHEWERTLACRPQDLERLPVTCPIPQQSCFFRRALLANRATPLRTDLHFTMDIDLYCHFVRHGARWRFIDDVLGTFEMSGHNKSSLASARHLDELELLFREQLDRFAWLVRGYRRWYLPIESRIPGVRPRLRTWLWGWDWRLKSLTALMVGCRQFKYVDWSWCAPSRESAS